MVLLCTRVRCIRVCMCVHVHVCVHTCAHVCTHKQVLICFQNPSELMGASVNIYYLAFFFFSKKKVISLSGY